MFQVLYSNSSPIYLHEIIIRQSWSDYFDYDYIAMLSIKIT